MSDVLAWNDPRRLHAADKKLTRGSLHNPSIGRNLSDVQFKYSKVGTQHAVQASSPGNEYLGHIGWDAKSGVVDYVHTHHEYRGLGIGTSLWEKARDVAGKSGIVSPQHSRKRTFMGDGLAKAVGGSLPPRAKGIL